MNIQNTTSQKYISQFNNAFFVIKMGGEVLQNKEILTKILSDIQFLHDQGMKIILVHGGGNQADILADQLGHIPEKIEGRRITSDTDLEIAKMIFGGSLNLEILSIMKTLKMKGIRVSGVDGNLMTVIQRPVKTIDFGFVGDIEKINPQVLYDLCDKNYIPVVSPLAVTDEGMIVNINADTIAIEIAISLKVQKLILLSQTDGVLDAEKNLISELSVSQCQKLIDEKTATDGMAVKLTNCMRAIENGIAQVHIINGLSEESLLKEVLTEKGVGTMII